MPRLVLLTGPFEAHTAFVNYVASHLPVSAVVRETRFVSSRPFARRAWDTVRANAFNPGRLADTVRRWRDARRADDELLRRAGRPAVAPTEYAVHDLNSPDGISLVESLKPDIIAVCGTGLLNSAVFSSARHFAVNVHLGLAPRYRGSHCVFWPLYNDEPEWVGVTIHELSAGIDAGAILVQGRPRLDEADTLSSLVLKCQHVGHELMVDVLTRAGQQELHGVPQDLPQGRNYNAREVTAEKEEELAARLARGLLRDHLRAHGGVTADVRLIRAW